MRSSVAKHRSYDAGTIEKAMNVFLKKLKIHWPMDPSTSLLCIYSREIKSKFSRDHFNS